MKTETVKARRGGKVIAEREERVPETIDDCLELENGSESNVVSHYWQSRRVNIQASLRGPTAGQGKRALDIYNRCIAAGTTEEQARAASRYEG